MLTFPSILRPIAGGFAPNAKTISGGQTIGGLEQVVSSANDRWQAAFKFPLNRKPNILAIRAFLLGLRGRANTVLLPAFDLDRPPYAIASASPIGTVFTSTFFQDYPELSATAFRYSLIAGLTGTATVNSAFALRLNVTGGAITAGVVVDCSGIKQKITGLSDLGGGLYDVAVEPGFTLVPGVRTAPVADLAADAAVGDISVSINMSAGLAPVAGHLFSIGSRLYSITDISGSGPYICDIWPTVREASPATTSVNFAAPACEMRLASDTEGADALKQMDLLRFGTITLNFDESPPAITPGIELREDGGFELREV